MVIQVNTNAEVNLMLPKDKNSGEVGGGGGREGED